MAVCVVGGMTASPNKAACTAVSSTPAAQAFAAAVEADHISAFACPVRMKFVCSRSVPA